MTTGKAEKQVHGEAEERGDDDGPIKVVRDRRLVLWILALPARRLLYVAIVQTLLVAVLLLTGNLLPPTVSSGVQDQAGGTYVVSLIVFLVVAVSIAAGFWFALAGALRVRAAVGVPVAAALTAVMAVVPVSGLRVGGASVGPHLAEVWLRWGQLSALTLLGVWVLWVAVARRRAGGGSGGRPDARWRGRALAGALAVIAVYYALELAIWGAYAGAGQARTGTGFLLDDLGVQSVLLPPFLTLLLLRYSTDLLEWGEITARSIPVYARRFRLSRSFMIVTPLVAVAMIVNVLRADRSQALPELIVAGILAGLVSLLVRSAPCYAGWSDEIRTRAVILGAVAVFTFTTLLLDATSAVGRAVGLSPLVDGQLYALVGTPVLLAVLTAGLFVLARGSAGKPLQRQLGLFLVMAGLLTFVAGLPAFLSAVHWPVFPGRHFSLLSGIQLAVALGTLIWTARLLARKQLNESAGRLADVFLLLAGLQIVTWLIELLKVIAALGNRTAFWLAGLFLLAGFWGLITSGEDLTSAEASTPAYPRDGRVLLYASYTLIGNATVLYLGTLHVRVPGEAASDYLTADFVSPAGLGILGTALVVLAFILKKGNRAPAAAAAPAPPPGPAKRPANVPLAILRGGTLVTVMAVILVLVSGVPRLIQASATSLSQAYTAPIPGRDCDTGGASWSVPPGDPVSTRCLAAGLQVTAAARSAGDVQFLPPSGVFPQNYSVSVHVDLSHLPDGCVSIATRGSAAGFYSSYICTSGIWAIQVISTTGTPVLSSGSVGKAANYTIEATSDNPDQRITIDGSQATAINTKFTATKYVSLGISTSGPQGGSVVFSDFTFTPLA